MLGFKDYLLESVQRTIGNVEGSFFYHPSTNQVIHINDKGPGINSATYHANYIVRNPHLFGVTENDIHSHLIKQMEKINGAENLNRSHAQEYADHLIGALKSGQYSTASFGTEDDPQEDQLLGLIFGKGWLRGSSSVYQGKKTVYLHGNNGDATRAVRQISKNHPNIDTVRIDVENPNDVIPGARKIEHSLEGAEEFADHVLRNGMPRKGRGTVLAESSAAWQRSEGKDPEGGLNRKGVASYRREHPGSKLSMAVTTKPSKLKPGSKSAKRRKSFCSRMKGMKAKLTSAKTARDPDSRINKSLRKWNC